jgi:hypothetical protein
VWVRFPSQVQFKRLKKPSFGKAFLFSAGQQIWNFSLTSRNCLF